MAKPIAFIDASYLVTLSNLGDLGGAILAKLAANYEIHTGITVTPISRPLVKGHTHFFWQR